MPASRETASVLFVCMGNICRSPTAEGLLRHLVAERGLEERVRVDSAGTIDYHEGAPPDFRMAEAAARRGYELTGRSRPIVSEDAYRFDLVVAMDRSNLADVHEVLDGGPAEVRLLSDFLDEGAPVDVPDPYYGGRQGFERVLDLLEEASPRILAYLLGEKNGL